MRANGVSDVTICCVHFFVTKSIDCHCKKFDTLIEVFFNMRRCSATYVQPSLSKSIGSRFVTRKFSEAVAHDLKTFLYSFSVSARFI